MKLFKYFCVSALCYMVTIVAVKWPEMRRFFIQDAEAREIAAPAPTPKPKFVTKAELKELIIPRARSAGLDPRIFFVLAGKESGDKWQINRERWEPTLFERFRSLFERGMTRREQERFSTSYGLFQVVYGFHAGLCGLDDFTELFDPETNIECAVKVWQAKSLEVERAMEKQKVSLTAQERTRETFRRYNGGGPRAEEYASHAISLYTDLLFEDAKNNR